MNYHFSCTCECKTDSGIGTEADFLTWPVDLILILKPLKVQIRTFQTDIRKSIKSRGTSKLSEHL